MANDKESNESNSNETEEEANSVEMNQPNDKPAEKSCIESLKSAKDEDHNSSKLSKPVTVIDESSCKSNPSSNESFIIDDSDSEESKSDNDSPIDLDEENKAKQKPSKLSSVLISTKIKENSIENIDLTSNGVISSSSRKSSFNDRELNLTPTTFKTASLVVFSPKSMSEKQQIIPKDILLNGQKVFLVNGTSIKDDSEKGKKENINIICLPNNFAVKPGKSLLTNGGDKVGIKSIDKLFNGQHAVAVKTNMGPKFIPLTKNLSSKISVNVTTPKRIAPKPAPKQLPPQEPAPKQVPQQEPVPKKVPPQEPAPKKVPPQEPTPVPALTQSVKKPFEILRTKLMENIPTETVTKIRPVMKKDEEESPAVAKARSEFMKYRKQLIEAAIYPQLPTFKPMTGYLGPTFTCEECDDTFTCAESLKNHKNRRSVLFTYACPLCKCTIEFFNRCTFLLHVRSHDANVKACYLTISVIPADKLNFKLLQRDENETPPSITRGKDRTITRKESEDSNESEIRENGLDKIKSVHKSLQGQHEALKSIDFIRALKKSKFISPYLRRNDFHRNVLNSDSSDSESSSDEETAESKSDESPKVNGDGESRLKYFLTADNVNPKPVKRISEEKQIEPIKKSRTETVEKSTDTKDEPIKPKPTVIIKTKTSSMASTSKETDKNADEIALSSSDDEEDSVVENCEDKDRRVVCRDCQKEVSNLNKHYRAENRPLKEYPCERCKFFNPSACALAAHNRMHTKTQPYICPDCGFYFSTLESFQTHVRHVCYYDYKTIRFQCPQCSILKPSVPQFTEHLKRCHTKDVFKCSLCITSAYSPKVVEIHMKKKHEGESGTVLEGYRCMLCPHMLVPKKSIDSHISKHVFNLAYLRYVYICKCCNKYASGKITKFMNHLRVCGEKKRDSMKARGKSLPDKTTVVKPKKIIRVVKSSEGAMEEKDPLSVEEWEADKLKAEFLPKAKICVMCQSSDIDEKSKSLFCNECVRYVNAEDNANETSGSSETQPDNGRPKRKFKCRLCKQFMNKDWATITQHYEKDHHADFNVKTDGKRSSREDPRKTESSVNIIKKRKLSLKEIVIPKIKTPAPAPELHKYKCVKCNLGTNDKEEFRKHIPVHKSPHRIEFQCTECGACFIVKYSLIKHLLVAHDIRYPGGTSDGKAKGGEKTEITRAENQCGVCFLKCDSKQNYDKHIRTHGMAFVAMQSRVREEKTPLD